MRISSTSDEKELSIPKQNHIKIISVAVASNHHRLLVFPKHLAQSV
jgi:hypothetical protein